MSLRGRLKKRIQIEAPEVTDLISKDGQFEEGGVSISKSGMSISSVSSSSSVSSTSSAGFASPIPTSEEDIKLDDLELLEDIGRGSGGVVKKVLHKVSGKLMALKIIPLDVNSQVRKRILLELKTLYHSQSPHIVNFYGAFFTEGHIYICLELMDAGSLHSLLEMTGPFPEPVIAEVSKQVLKGLHYLHKERHLVHRDIKPSNILVNSAGEVKISDFGVSGQLASSISSCVSWVGTVTYMSPERIQGQSHSTQSDIWSLGLSIFELALGRFPYLPPGAKLLTREAGLGFWELLDQIVKQDTPQLPQGVYSPQLASFISACLCKDPDQRPSASDLLEHPFIKNSSPKNFDLSGWICQYVKPSNPPLSPLSSTSEPSLKTTESNPEKDKEKRLPEGVASLRVSLSSEIGEKKLTATRSKEFKRLERSESGEGEKKADVSMMMMKKLF